MVFMVVVSHPVQPPCTSPKPQASSPKGQGRTSVAPSVCLSAFVLALMSRRFPEAAFTTEAACDVCTKSATIVAFLLFAVFASRPLMLSLSRERWDSLDEFGSVLNDSSFGPMTPFGYIVAPPPPPHALFQGEPRLAAARPEQAPVPAPPLRECHPTRAGRGVHRRVPQGEILPCRPQLGGDPVPPAGWMWCGVVWGSICTVVRFTNGWRVGVLYEGEEGEAVRNSSSAGLELERCKYVKSVPFQLPSCCPIDQKIDHSALEATGYLEVVHISHMICR